MILSPLTNTGIQIAGQWIQKRPYVTQKFGARPEVYKQFGHLGHNGLDLRAKTGTPIYMPFDGFLRVHNEGNKGYGLYVELFKDNLKLVIAHLSEVFFADKSQVYMGDKIALSGNTGFSNAPHVHLTLKFLEDGKVVNPNNGYAGAVDLSPFLLTWKGTLLNTNL